MCNCPKKNALVINSLTTKCLILRCNVNASTVSAFIFIILRPNPCVLAIGDTDLSNNVNSPKNAIYLSTTAYRQAWTLFFKYCYAIIASLKSNIQTLSLHDPHEVTIDPDLEACLEARIPELLCRSNYEWGWRSSKRGNRSNIMGDRSGERVSIG